MTAARRRSLASVLALALAWPSVAAAEPKDPAAREQLERGQAALGRDDYEGAIAAYQRALAIEREPKVLYLLGQAEFLRGNCRESVGYFTQVKEFEIGSAVEEAMRPYLAECAERLLEQPEPEPAEIEPQPQPQPQPAETSEMPVDDGPAPARRWYQDPLGDTLVAIGVVGAAAGGSMLGVAQGRHGGAANYGALEDAADGIRTLRIAGAATLGVGAALMIGGFVRWGVAARRFKTSNQAQVGVLYDGITAGATLRVRF